ncbi:2-hydroxyacyl-CoA dehydratase family protein [Christensenellaceae bacterium OttesenSCG-928-M15]|nr:2-hydroxyacyl-CoA dehydratase family protein [Christensenellaceae bacterium OttesenSCG-928-M15]
MEANRLPQKFEEYADARKAGFLKVKQIKEQGGLVAGTFCTFTPVEVLDAANIHSVSLCGMSEETIPDAERELPKNLCPLIKSSYGFAVSDKCPYTYFADIIIGETTCDGKKKMYEMLGELKEMYVLQLPQGIDRGYSKELWKKELELFVKFIEERFSLEITEEQLRGSADRYNRLRAAKCRLMELQKLDPPPMGGFSLYKYLEGTGFTFDVETTIKAIDEYVAKIQAEYEKEKPDTADKKRILISGCPIGGAIEKVTSAVEENDGIVVCFENCGGIKPMRFQVDTGAEDIIGAIAEEYLSIGCAVMSPNKRREETMPELVKEFKVDGVIDVVLQACHPYSVESRAMKKLCNDNETPYLMLETDYSKSDGGQIDTRIAAFIETL